MIEFVWNQDTGDVYKRGTDYNDGASPDIIAGSQLQTDNDAGDTIKYVSKSFDTSSASSYTIVLDESYSGIRELANADDSWGDGSAVDIDVLSLHLYEYLDKTSSHLKFETKTSETLAVDDYILLRLRTVDGSSNTFAEYEWKGIVANRDEVTGTDGEQKYLYTVSDLSHLLRTVDISDIPEKVNPEIIDLPNDVNRQTLIGGLSSYSLEQLLSDLFAGLSVEYTLNAPDVFLRKMKGSTGLELLKYALESTGYYMNWQVVEDMPTLVISSHEHLESAVETVISDKLALEISEQVNRNESIDYVEIEIPTTFEDSEVTELAPTQELPVMNILGVPLLPLAETATEDAVTAYEIHETWTPLQEYTDIPAGPIFYRLSDTAYNTGEFTEHELIHILKYEPERVSASSPYRWIAIRGRAGYEYYFIFNPIVTETDTVDAATVYGYVVERQGYYTITGRISKEQTPIGGANVILVGETTGVILGPTTTNADGFYSLDTEGNQDKWLPHVWTDDDEYLGNRDEVDDYAGRDVPVDDDSSNDDLGPDNSEPMEQSYQVHETPINFILSVYPDSRTGTATTHETYEGFKYAGGYSFGSAGNRYYVDESKLDTANITTEWQANQLAEKLINESSEQAVIVTEPFLGSATSVGTAVYIDSLSQSYRVASREVVFKDGGLLIESISNVPDSFLTEIGRRYASHTKQETGDSRLLDKLKKHEQRLKDFSGLDKNSADVQV